MRKTLNDFIEERLQDLCTQESFCFGVKCEHCGEILSVPPIKFVKAGIEPKNESEKVIFKTMYMRDKELAYDRAIEILAGVFNYCPICKRIVCNNCFIVTGDIDICIDCAEKLGISGTVVSSLTDDKCT